MWRISFCFDSVYLNILYLASTSSHLYIAGLVRTHDDVLVLNYIKFYSQTDWLEKNHLNLFEHDCFVCQTVFVWSVVSLCCGVSRKPQIIVYFLGVMLEFRFTNTSLRHTRR